MEVTGALSSCARGAGFNFGEDTAFVAVQHMLYQTVDMFQAAEEIGLNHALEKAGIQAIPSAASPIMIRISL